MTTREYQAIKKHLNEWYGDKFDASRYISPRATGAYWDNIDDKDYYLKMRGNVPYLWTVYVDKVAIALEKIRG